MVCYRNQCRTGGIVSTCIAPINPYLYYLASHRAIYLARTYITSTNTAIIGYGLRKQAIEQCVGAVFIQINRCVPAYKVGRLVVLHGDGGHAS